MDHLPVSGIDGIRLRVSRIVVCAVVVDRTDQYVHAERRSTLWIRACRNGIGNAVLFEFLVSRAGMSGMGGIEGEGQTGWRTTGEE
jgi:hypothetical protein